VTNQQCQAVSVGTGVVSNSQWPVFVKLVLLTACQRQLGYVVVFAT